MANPHRGHVAFKVGERDYTLSFSINAMVELEDHLDMPIAQIAKKMEDPTQVRIAYLRAILWAALRDFHPDVDLLAAGQIATESGAGNVMEAIKQCFKAAFPEAEVKKKADPKKAAKA